MVKRKIKNQSNRIFLFSSVRSGPERSSEFFFKLRYSRTPHKLGQRCKPQLSNVQIFIHHSKVQSLTKSLIPIFKINLWQRSPIIYRTCLIFKLLVHSVKFYLFQEFQLYCTEKKKHCSLCPKLLIRKEVGILSLTILLDRPIDSDKTVI